MKANTARTSGVLGGLCGAAVLTLGIAAGAAPRTHDGFQFRGALGGGYLSDSVRLDGSSADVGIHGGAGALELYFGGTPASGLTVGGFLGSTAALGPKISVNGQEVGSTTSDVSLNLVTVGPYVGFYPSATAGFHLLGDVGFAAMSVSNGSSSSQSATGFALGAGVGYDWWVSDEWSLGVLGRFTYAGVTDGGETHSAVAPALMFSVVCQ